LSSAQGHISPGSSALSEKSGNGSVDRGRPSTNHTEHIVTQAGNATACCRKAPFTTPPTNTTSRHRIPLPGNAKACLRKAPHITPTVFTTQLHNDTSAGNATAGCRKAPLITLAPNTIVLDAEPRRRPRFTRMGAPTTVVSHHGAALSLIETAIANARGNPGTRFASAHDSASARSAQRSGTKRPASWQADQPSIAPPQTAAREQRTPCTGPGCRNCTFTTCARHALPTLTLKSASCTHAHLTGLCTTCRGPTDSDGWRLSSVVEPYWTEVHNGRGAALPKPPMPSYHPLQPSPATKIPPKPIMLLRGSSGHKRARQSQADADAANEQSDAQPDAAPPPAPVHGPVHKRCRGRARPGPKGPPESVRSQQELIGQAQGFASQILDVLDPKAP
jgi:hypothetical protein